jgi:proliferating cell nuclear antigen
MFEARILQGQILKKIIEAMRELVTDANLECHAEMGITMQVSADCLSPIDKCSQVL